VTYAVRIAEHSAYMDAESPPRPGGTFPTREEAEAEARRIVDRSLDELYRPPMGAEEFFRLYTLYGDDPYVVPEHGPQRFSAMEYARRRCRELCSASA
jgi:hypothetical protein